MNINMVTCGIDVGSECVKVVLLRENKIIGSTILNYGREPVSVRAHKAFGTCLAQAGITHDELVYILATGSNRDQYRLAQGYVSEPSCCARGANWLGSSIKTVVDLGCNQCIALRCTAGNVFRIARSDKCASGTGRYIKIISRAVGVNEEEAGQLSLRSQKKLDIQAYCTVFAESEIISLIHQGYAREDILAGAFRGLAQRMYPLLLKVGLEKDVALVGGLASNVGTIRAFEAQLGSKVVVPESPILIAALGAGILAQERYQAMLQDASRRPI